MKETKEKKEKKKKSKGLARCSGTNLYSTLKRWGQMELCEFSAIMVCMVRVCITNKQTNKQRESPHQILSSARLMEHTPSHRSCH